MEETFTYFGAWTGGADMAPAVPPEFFEVFEIRLGAVQPDRRDELRRVKADRKWSTPPREIQDDDCQSQIQNGGLRRDEDSITISTVV